MQQLDYNNENGMFSVWNLPRCYEQRIVKYSSVRESLKRELEPEVEKQPLLEAAT
jgi:hypothetical protein